MYYDLLDLYKQKKYKEFLVLFHEYIKDRKNGIDEVLMFEYAKVLIKNHKDDEASNVLRLIIKLNSNSQYAHLELGKLYAKKDCFEAAEKEFRKCIEIDNDKTPHARLELGKLYSKKDCFEAAEKELRKCIEIDGDKSPHGYLELAMLYSKLNDLDAAFIALFKSMEISKDNPHPYVELGKLYVRTGNLDKAEELFKKSTELCGNKMFCPYFELGKLYSSQGRIEEAKLAYNKIYDMVYKKYQDAEAQLLHIKKHNKDNLYKSKHSVFNVDIMDVINYFYENDFESVPGSGCDIYNIYYKNAGYEGGYDGDGHIQDYVTILTTPGNKEEIITMYPSDKRVIEEDFKKKTIK